MKIISRVLFIVSLFLATTVQAQSSLNYVTGLNRMAQLVQDTDGIPHIIARNEHDLYFLLGWVHAEDRLFQMDLSRRQASGTVAELLGSAALAQDVELRTIGLRRAAERSLPLLSDKTRALLEAYAEGINAYVERQPLPPEYSVLERSTFEPWTPLDSVAVGKLFAFGLSFTLDLESTEALSKYQAAGAAEGFNGQALFFDDLFRSAPFDPASTIPDVISAPAKAIEETPRPLAQMAKSTATLSSKTIALCRRYLTRVQDLPLFRHAITPGGKKSGSNEWVVSGRHTVNGLPLIANDPHLILPAPSIFYQMHLMARQAGINVFGSGIAGIPFVILGQNQHLAWGATVNPLDVTDVFQERLVPDANSPSGLSILHQGRSEPIIPLPQVFRYNQTGDGITDNLTMAPPNGTVGDTPIPAAVLIVPRRNMGPIIELDIEAGVALSVQYTGFSGTRELDALRLFDSARKLDDFVDAMQFLDFGSVNFAYADVEGNIAYFTSAEIPLREDLQAGFVNGLPPFVVRDGTGGNEWIPVIDPQPGQAVPYEILPFAEMPQILNPPAGYFVNANNDPLGITLDNNAFNQLRPGGGIFYLSSGYDLGIRAGRITTLLEEQLEAGPVDADDMKAIQADVVMVDAEVFTTLILEALKKAATTDEPILAKFAADDDVVEAVGRLAAWDYSTPTGITQGYDSSDSDGERFPPDENEVAASVAATIYAVWRAQLIENTIDAVLEPRGLPKPGSQRTMTALRNILDNFSTNQGIGASGINFFNVPGVEDAETRRDIVILRSIADALDRLASKAFESAFGGSTNQNDYRWGRLHRVVLKHTLGKPFDIPPAGGAFPAPMAGLTGIPVDGGFSVVDSAGYSVRAYESDDFMFEGGPVYRYVGAARRGRRGFLGETILPGGASGVLDSPFYSNLLGRWLTNDTYPIRQNLVEIFNNVFERRFFLPEKGRIRTGNSTP